MKDTILQKLKEAKGQYVSGTELGCAFNVTRTAIWKWINELKDEGYNIESSSKKGYRILETDDILNAFELKDGLHTDFIGREIHFRKEVDSTNSEAKRLASEGCDDGTAVVASVQTQGRGRLGREWDSMNEKGIWISVVLRPVMLPQDVQLVTLAASVAVVNAINKITGIKTGIKWPNDIILNNKKLCGILTEMSSEVDRINYMIIGIGLNVNQDKEDFSHDVREKATSLKISASEGYISDRNCRSVHFVRSHLIKGILEELEHMYEFIQQGNTGIIISEWKKHSVTIGSEIKMTIRGEHMEGRALDITSEGKLKVQCKDGVLREVASGEISIRGMMGYI